VLIHGKILWMFPLCFKLMFGGPVCVAQW
jgi:hypothetical protein